MRTLLLAIIAGLLGLSACKGSAPLPAKALALNHSGVEALEEGDLETADARFALALEYNPAFVEALTNLALVEMQRGNFQRARQFLERARRLNPDIAQPHHGLGVLSEREKRPDRASENYQDALRVDPGFAPSRANYARLLFDSDMLDHARIQFKRLVEVAPNEPLGYSGLAESLLRLGRVAEAEQVVRIGRKRFANSPELTLLHARAQIRRGHYKLAVELLTPLAHAHDDIAVVALGWLATAELARGRPRFALLAARRATKLEPNHPLAVYALAMTLSRLEHPEASAWLERARAMIPGDMTLERALAQALQRRRR